MLSFSSFRPAAAVTRFAAAAGLTVAAAVLSTTGLSANDVKVGDLTLEQPWTRATPSGARMAGGFVVIANAGAEPDRLIGGSAVFADKVEIHEMTMEGDVMKMREVEGGIEIPAGGAATLKPGSYHIMFMGLTRPLMEGENVKGTLVFEKAGTVDVDWAVAGMGAKAPMQHGHGHGQ